VEDLRRSCTHLKQTEGIIIKTIHVTHITWKHVSSSLQERVHVKDKWLTKEPGVHYNLHKSRHQFFPSQTNLALVFTARFSFDAVKWCPPRTATLFLDRRSCGQYIAVSHLRDLGLCDGFIFHYGNLMLLRSDCLSPQRVN